MELMIIGTSCAINNNNNNYAGASRTITQYEQFIEYMYRISTRASAQPL